MASNNAFKGFQKISNKTLQQIAQLKPLPAKELLAQELGIPPYEDTKDVQKAPFVSYIYDHIMFAVEKGFPWEHISHVVKFSHDYLKKILVENHQLSDAVRNFKELGNILDPLSDRHKQQYTDFVFDTVLQHYNLFKYVFSHLREIVHPSIEKEIFTPSVPQPLKEGKDIIVWQYEEKVKVVSDKESALLCNQKDHFEKISEEPTEHKTLNDLDAMPIPYSKMASFQRAAIVTLLEPR